MRRFVPLALAALVLAGTARAEGPLTLAEAMARARERSREVAAAEARKSAASERARQASGFRWPVLSVSEMYVRTDSPAEAFAFKLNKGEFSFPDFVGSDPNHPDTSATSITRFEATLPIFTGGELSGRIQQAKDAAKAASSTATFTADKAAREAADAYVMLAQAEEYTALLTKARETVKAHVDLAKRYVEEGMLVRSELLRAEVELSRVDDLLESAKGNVRVANAALAFRLGEPQASTWELAPLPAPVPLEGDVASWVASAASRQDLLAAKSLLAAGELEEKVKRAAFLPKVGIQARHDIVGQRLFTSSGSGTTLMAVASIGFNTGLADRAALVAAREDARAGREDVARFEEGIALEVRQAYEEAVTARARHATAVKALEAARETERITDERWKSGVVKTIDLLDAATARREAETRELVARAEAQASALKLAQAAGRRPESVLP